MRIPWLKLYLIAILIFLFFPLLLIVLFSFNDNMLSTFPFTGFTMRWYSQVFDNRNYILGFEYSTIVAAAAAIGSGILGTMGAYGLNRYHVRLSGTMLSFMTLPIVIPGLVLGIAMLSYFTFLGMQLSLTTVIFAHIVFSTPYVLLIMNARLHNFDWALEEAARDLGANVLQRFAQILFPLTRPSIIGAMLLVIAISFDEFIVTFFVIGNQSTLPMVMWGMLKQGVSPTLNAISSILLLGSAVLLFLALRIFHIKLEF